MDWSFVIQSFLGLAAVVNPVGSLPMYVAMTDGRDLAARRGIGRMAALTVLVTLATFMLVGSSLLAFFGVSLPAFKVAGGILLLGIGIAFLHGTTSKAKLTEEEAREAADWRSVAIVPLGIPLLAGPGAISTAVVLGNVTEDWAHRGALLAVIVGVAALTAAVFYAAEWIQRLLGRVGITIIGRIMGLILAALAVQFMADGLVELFPILGTGRSTEMVGPD